MSTDVNRRYPTLKKVRPAYQSSKGRIAAIVRIPTFTPTDDSVSLSSFGGQGRGEEAAPSRNHSQQRVRTPWHASAFSPCSAGGEREKYMVAVCSASRI